MIALAFTALAWGQEDPEPREEPGPYTIEVYDEDSLRQAREAVVEDLEDLGWTLRSEGDDLVFDPPRDWLGKAVLHADGRLSFGRRVVSGVRPSATRDPSAATHGCGTLPDRPLVAYSGDLVTVSGERPDDDLAVTFSLYESLGDARPVWQETHVLAVRDGAYSVLLGVLEPLDTLDWTRTYWLGVSTSEISEAGRTRFAPHVVRRYSGRGGCAPGGEWDPWSTPLPSVGVSFRGPASRQKVWRHHERALEATQDSRAHLREVIAGLALQEHLARLPYRLDALWERGVPLYGEERIDGLDARRRAILDLWATRADSPYGHAVCEAIEDWLAATVLPSEAPITPEEYTRYEARRPDGRRLPRPVAPPPTPPG